ncbi:DNA-binding response regulator [Arcobacter sp. CECT 8986]|uniref:response regulator transcription factor n=1 Tax=Arcobacter sp. CECT 8986 TaxID=2044507 RepID=UPI001009B8D8|nr:response regulator transcription factor [Arcobacter sp. CECT 8986]RXJ98775.1 DNA-binding response regulator [Arcobacter sp. CECT 8986]
MNKHFCNLSILYAEDDDKIRENTNKILKLLYDDVYTCKDGKEALEAFHKYRPNIILTDYKMPLLDGYELTKQIREICEKTPIVIMSNYTDKEKLLKCIPLNLTSYLEKPVRYEDLLETLTLCKEASEKNNLIKFTINNILDYNFRTKKLFVEDTEVNLSKIETTILEYFINKKNQLISKDEIAALVKNEEYINDNTLKNIIYRLRKKVGKDLITNYRSFGYMLEVKT